MKKRWKVNCPKSFLALKILIERKFHRGRPTKIGKKKVI